MGSNICIGRSEKGQPDIMEITQVYTYPSSYILTLTDNKCLLQLMQNERETFWTIFRIGTCRYNPYHNIISFNIQPYVFK